jgi:hypothetical protein
VTDIIKKVKNPWGSAPNTLLNDKHISLKAKGLYTFMESKAGGWVFSASRLEKLLKESRKSILTAMSELKDNGWLSYKKNKDGSGVYELLGSYVAESPFVMPQSQNAPNPKSQNDTVPKGDSISKKEKALSSKKDYSSEKNRFDVFRESYPKKKSVRGLDTEFNYFINKHKDWKKVLPILESLKLTVASFGQTDPQFVPDFRKFICNRHWEMYQQNDSIPTLNHKTAEENENLAKEREREQYLEAQAS